MISLNLSLRQFKKQLIGLVITALCLFVFFNQIDIQEVLKSLTRVKWGYLFVGTLSLSLGYLMRILRWSLMLRTLGANTVFVECVAPFLGSVALNNILPLRVGDVVRALIFPVSMGITRITATSSLVMERIVDLNSLLLCFAIGLFSIHKVTIPDEIKSLALLLTLIFGAALLAGIIFSEKLSYLILTLAEKKGSKVKLGVIYKTLGQLLVGLNSMSKPKILLRIVIISIFVWIGEAGLFYFLLLGTGVESSQLIALLVMSLATLSTLVPSSPGYVGTFHLAAFTAISLIGGTAVQAVSYSVLVHLALWIPTTIAGVIAIWMSPELFRVTKFRVF